MQKGTIRDLGPVGVAVGLWAVVCLTGWTGVADRMLFDAGSRWWADPGRVPENVVLVLIDEPSVAYMAETHRHRWPWPREVFADLFVALKKAGAERVAVDLLFMEHDRAEADEMLGAYAAACGGVVLAESQGRKPVIWFPEPSRSRPELALAGRTGHVDYAPDADGVVRRVWWPDSLAAVTLGDDGTKRPARPLVRWYGRLAEWPAAQRLSARPFLEAATGPGGFSARLARSGVDESDPEAVGRAMESLPELDAGGALRGKTVFLGVNIASAFDTKAVPVGGLEPGVLIHATAWANAVRGDFYREPAAGWMAGIAVLILAAAFGPGWRTSSVGRALFWVGAGICLVTVPVLLMPAGWWIPGSVPGWAALSGGLVLGWHGWRRDARRKREIQELFGSYVSPAVVKRLLEDPEAIGLGGERRELTVYFSDLAGFTDMSETMKPDELLRVVNAYLGEMTEFILEEGGYLDKYIGDAIMGVFGAPEESENHAVAACRAAVRSRDHLAALQSRWQELHGVRLHARIGINTGEMIVGNVGSARKRNYTVVGDAVNLASRLEGANKEYGTVILAGPDTVRKAGAAVVSRPVDLLRVKGKTKPVLTHEILGLAGETDAETVRLAEVFGRAHGLYLAGSFGEARGLFEVAETIRPGDTLIGIYLARCAELLARPPGPGWDGVHVMKGK